MREYHVRFCERFRGEIPLYLLDYLPFLLFIVLQELSPLYIGNLNSEYIGLIPLNTIVL